MDQEKVVTSLKVLHELLGVAEHFSAPGAQQVETVADELVKTLESTVITTDGQPQ